jgi:acetoacetyl-CoA synthetase
VTGHDTEVAPFWSPDPAATARSEIVRFGAWLADTGRANLVDPSDYGELWHWSADQPAGFWRAVFDYFDVPHSAPPTQILAGTYPEHAKWFTGAEVNFVESLFRATRADRTAAVFLDENGESSRLTFGELEREVASLSATLRSRGVAPGDRVVGYLTHSRYALVGFLAAATVGAVWSHCAPDYAAAAAVARLGQLNPTVLIAIDGYDFNGKHNDCREQVRQLVAGIGSLQLVVWAQDSESDWEEVDLEIDVISWAQAVAGEVPLQPTQVPFDHPLWVLFTSGTTGKPKGVVHGHGGMLLQQLVFARLHLDLGPDDVYLWYTSTNWVMWNIQISALLGGTTIVAYDGSPAFPGVGRLWELASDYGVTVLGTSPGYLAACEKAGWRPTSSMDLSALRVIGCTGSIVPEQNYHWVRDTVGAKAQLASVSGGTDIAGAFVAAAPTTPVWAGEISAPALGVALDAFAPDGSSLRDEVGELVVTKPMPSMPLGIWGDDDGRRYHDAYFSTFPGVWRQGDWITITPRNSVVMHGRSDATLNRKGVRLGSADIYAVVERFPEVVDSLVVGVEQRDGGYWMPMFVVLARGVTLDEGLVDRLNSAIREQTSPRHVPDEIRAVTALPHTRTGKKLEIPVKRILQGARQGEVVDPGAVDDATSLDYFAALARERQTEMAQ